MTLDSVHYLPIAVFVLLPATFIATYVIAISLGHVEIEFPYISDTGTHTPESCIFSQMLNIVSFLVALTIYVRYKQIEQYYRDHLSPESSKILQTNIWALWVGCISAFGLSVVANFQETSVFRVHMVGALSAFGFGVVYAWLQTMMSFKMIPLVNSRHTACVRLILSMIMTCTFMTSSICGPMAFRQFHGADPTKWGRHDGGWPLHIVSTICEWVSALSLDSFILTFAREMHLISLSSPRVMFVIERLDLPTPENSLLQDSLINNQQIIQYPVESSSTSSRNQNRLLTEQETIRFSGTGHESFTSSNTTSTQQIIVQ